MTTELTEKTERGKNQIISAEFELKDAVYDLNLEDMLDLLDEEHVAKRKGQSIWMEYRCGLFWALISDSDEPDKAFPYQFTKESLLAEDWMVVKR